MYRIFDFLLDSTIPLPELPEAVGENADFIFRLSGTHRIEEPEHWIHHWHDEDNSITLSIGRRQQDYLLRFPDTADFMVNPECTRILGYPASNIDLPIVRHVFLDQVLPRLASRKGELVLHSSAILHDKGVLAFMGNTGSGKSTLASSFHMQNKSILTDDCLMLRNLEERIYCVPSYTGSRLWTDSYKAVVNDDSYLFDSADYNGKKRLYLHAKSRTFDPGDLPLIAIFILGEKRDSYDDFIDIEKLSGQNAVMAIIQCAFMLDVADNEESTQLFNTVSDLVRTGIPVYRLAYQHDYNNLQRIRDKILNMIKVLNQESTY